MDGTAGSKIVFVSGVAVYLGIELRFLLRSWYSQLKERKDFDKQVICHGIICIKFGPVVLH